MLPIQRIACFNSRVPSSHRSGSVRVAHAGKTLNVEPRRAPGAWPAEADAQDSKLRNDVIAERALCEMAHGQAGKCECRDVYHVRRDDAVPRQASLLREIVVAGAKSGQVDRHEAVLGAEGVARGKRVAIGKNVVDADRALIDDVTFIADIQIVVAVHARADDSRLPHHRAAAGHHAHVHIGLRNVGLQEELRSQVDVF